MGNDMKGGNLVEDTPPAEVNEIQKLLNSSEILVMTKITISI